MKNEVYWEEDNIWDCGDRGLLEFEHVIFASFEIVRPAKKYLF
jgi:hypothetical protein